MLYKLRWVIATLITAVVIALFAFGWWFFLAIRPANPSVKQAISYQLEPGTSVDDLAAQLQEAGIIKNGAAFKLLVTIRGLRPSLKAGSYDLNPNETMNDI
ncbi:MAG TPA: endolytic transglycosylase MltG, partial [Candidatus Polarisedimenticolaceae bacterium]|nr:endolytic transglycosylase MltG [Candidatus Polarisedimenticolaceae bacterium]